MMKQGLTKWQIAIMSITAGICVSGIYFNQPLLSDIAGSLHISEAAAGNIAVCSQAGYGLGLFFITPLGDKVNRRRLILILQLLLVLSLIGMSFAQTAWLISAMSLLVGLFAVAAQVIMPLAALLSPQNKGKVVGTIVTGILTGILAARVFSGYIAEWFGWRAVYSISSVLVLLSSFILYFSLPDVPVQFRGNYGQLLRSTLQQIGRFALLRYSAILGALVFGAFCSFWTTLTFHLSGAPFHYGTDVIGLFGLLAIVGALMAPWFGKLADKGNPARSQVISIAMLITSILCIQFFPNALWALVTAVLFLDLGVQATHVTNIAVIYTLDETAHSRINTVYMTSYFIGGAMGTFVGVQCWKAGGYTGVTWQLLVWSVIALLLALNRYRQIAKTTVTA